MPLWGCIRAQPHPAAALVKLLPCPVLSLGITLGVMSPVPPTQKKGSEPLMQAEHAQSNEDDPLLKGFCTSDTATCVVCSKPAG